MANPQIVVGKIGEAMQFDGVGDHVNISDEVSPTGRHEGSVDLLPNADQLAVAGSTEKLTLTWREIEVLK